MNHRITGKSGSPALYSGVLGLLLVLCLNAAILPCAMALDIDDQTCPHSPAKEQAAMDGHHGHGAGHARDPVAQSDPDCPSAAPSCCDLAVATVESRSAYVKFKQSFDEEPWVASANPNALQPVASQAITAHSDPPDPPGTSVPRHVLFCVYLD